jgi:hypothetical protein
VDTNYVIDASDRIIAVDEPWIAFAEANGAPDLARRVLGQTLWSFIADATVRELYRHLLARVRAVDRRITLPFRCDSDSERRFMTLSIGPAMGARGTLAFRASSIRVAPQPASARALFAAASAEVTPDDHPAGPGRVAGASVLIMCSACKRVDVDGWKEIDEAMERADLLASPVRPISHGLCAACYDEMLATLN